MADRMKRKYGVPYKGSKSAIADKLIRLLPACGTFCDLFAGGCAMTHAAMVSGKWERFMASDLDWRPIRLFIDSAHGRYTTKNHTEFVTREQFMDTYESDPYVAFCWSFGFDGRSYMYSRDIEPWKHAIHDYVFFDDSSALRDGFGVEPPDRYGIEPTIKFMVWSNFVRGNIDDIRKRLVICADDASHVAQLKYIQELESIERLKRLESLERLQSLERLESLERLQSLESLESLDYREVDVPNDGIAYCDIPYYGTNDYNVAPFDHSAFYDWASTRDFPVFISSYDIHDDRFDCVAEMPKLQSMSPTSTKIVMERLYVPHKQDVRPERHEQIQIDLFGEGGAR